MYAGYPLAAGTMGDTSARQEKLFLQMYLERGPVRANIMDRICTQLGTSLPALPDCKLTVFIYIIYLYEIMCVFLCVCVCALRIILV